MHIDSVDSHLAPFSPNGFQRHKAPLKPAPNSGARSAPLFGARVSRAIGGAIHPPIALLNQSAHCYKLRESFEEQICQAFGVQKLTPKIFLESG